MLTESEGQAVVGQVRRQSRRRRKLPEIPKDKKRNNIPYLVVILLNN